MKRIISLIALLVAIVAPLSSAAQTWTGAGTVDKPYLINNADELAQLATQVNGGNGYAGKYFRLTADLDLEAAGYGKGFNSGKGWIPIGAATKPFQGVFDGDGHTVSNLYINNGGSSGLNNAGLFGFVPGGTVKNLVLKNVDVTAYNNVGGVTGFIVNNGNVDSCHVSGALSGNEYVGGVVGFVENSSITNCYATGAVSGNYNVGGVAGFVLYNGNVDSCHVSGAVSGNNNVGGVVGEVWNSSVTNSYATGALSGNDNVGGVAGLVEGIEGSSSLTNCYATGDVSGNDNVGGVVGQIMRHIGSSSLTNCYATGDVSGNKHVGGVVGKDQGEYTNDKTSNVIQCYSTGAVSGNSCVGGVAGSISCSLANCYATGAVSGKYLVGGVVAFIQTPRSNVSNCAALNPSVTGDEDVGRVAGDIMDKHFVSLSNNIAWDGMSHGDGVQFSEAKDAALNGKDVSAIQIWLTAGSLFHFQYFPLLIFLNL